MENDIESEIEAANQAPALVICGGSYDSVEAYVRGDVEELVEAIEGLEDYPVLDENALSEYEMKLEDEAWMKHEKIGDEWYKQIGEVLVGSGQIELGDCGQVHVTVPTRYGDGVYPVTLITCDKGEPLAVQIDLDPMMMREGLK